MFFEAWLLIGILVGAIITLLFYQQHAKRKAKTEYAWQPEQDYDVLQEGESAMTPAFPKMKKRQKTPPPNHSDLPQQSKPISNTNQTR